MTVNDLVLFARNTGSFYQDHVLMAKNHHSIGDWETHIVKNVIPIYRRECNEPYDGMSWSEIGQASEELRAYYKQHIKEL